MIKQSAVIFDGKAKSGTVYINDKTSFYEEKLKPTPLAKVEIKPVLSKKIDDNQLRQESSGLKLSLLSKLSTARPFLTIFFSGLIGVSLFGALFFFWPIIVQEVRYRLITSSQTMADNKKIFPTNFSIVIPKIDAKSIIIANVDSADEKAYLEALKKGIAHAKGTCFPGMNCRMFLFAHSADSPFQIIQYNAVFYLLNKLEKGDQLIIYFHGKKILYEVTGKEIAGHNDTHYLTDLGNEEELILQTCDPPGTSLNRLLIFAKPRLIEYLK